MNKFRILTLFISIGLAYIFINYYIFFIQKNSNSSVASPGRSLKVVYAINPRFKRFDRDQIIQLLASAKKTAKEAFGLNVEFLFIKEMPISEIVGIAPNNVFNHFVEYNYDLYTDRDNLTSLIDATDYSVLHANTDWHILSDFAFPLLGQHWPTSKDFSRSLAHTWVSGVKKWLSVKLEDGEPVINFDPYNQWLVWNAIGYGDLDYDIVLTNQPIISVEYYYVDVPAIMREGITVGTTAYSKKGTFGAYSFFSTFVFNNDIGNLITLRGGEVYTKEEAALLAGSYLAHEIGHLVLHLGHPYNQHACIMNPVLGLKFRKWLREVDPKNCSVGSSQAMTPGTWIPSP
jgi:hypothetical protein